jgi:hypothetical protein
VMKSHTLDLCGKRDQFSKSYDHPEAHRTRSLSTKEATRLVDLSLSWVSRAAIIRGPECQAYATQTRGDR